MTYVTANLHGCYTKFMELLRQIKFKDRDVMYILGDIVDYGDEPMELVCDLSMRYNVFTIAGEHDFRAARMLSGFQKMLSSGNTSPDAKYIAEMQAWMQDGGKSTLDGYRALDAEMKEGALDYLSDMGLYEEISVGGKKYVLVHAGLGDLAEGGEGECAPEKFFNAPVDPTSRPMQGKTVIIGHIPTSEIAGAEDNCIYRGDGVIAVDCGAGRGGRIGCIRLEDGAEFYA
ncbi:MAG: metallophosphoesterase [Clostridia bacterium]|nr:metallophosphoesterase [Clostridia bacterium]